MLGARLGWPLTLFAVGCLTQVTPTRAPEPYAPPPPVEGKLSVGQLIERCKAEPQGEVFAAEIVDAAASAKVNAVLSKQHVSGRDMDFNRVVELFYETHEDVYDFIYFYAPDDGGSTWGLHEHVAVRNAQTIGLVNGGRPELAAKFPRLQSVMLMKLPGDDGGGPTLHELGHYWGARLGVWPELGFPSDSHWGETGVGGQLGGFKTDQLRCREPQEAVPPACVRDADGRFDVVIPPFGENANGGDGLPYAPLELYLMGLIPAEEVPPVAILRDAKRLNPGSSMAHRLYSVSDVHNFTVSEIAERSGGPPPPRIDAERELRIAFVYVTPEHDPVGLARVARQSRNFSGVEWIGPYSWCMATGGRSTVRTDLDGA